MNIPPTITALTSGAANTLTVNFNSAFMGIASSNVTSALTNITSVTAFSFSNAVIGGRYNIVLSITATANRPTLTITPAAQLTYRCDFTSLSAQIPAGSPAQGTQRNPLYIVMEVYYDGTNYYISGGLYNN
jgi:hypothetical protein